MPRKPKVRISYHDDGQFLLRLKTAIESDEKRSLAWRQKVAAMANNLAIALLTAPDPNGNAESEQGAPATRRRSRKAS